MKTHKISILMLAWPLTGFSAGPSLDRSVELHFGYVTKILCEGKLLASSVGNENLVRLDALPFGFGCAVLVKPMAASGKTNLVLETSAGSVMSILEITNRAPSSQDLKIRLPGDHL